MDSNIENITIKTGKENEFFSIIWDSQGNNHSLIIAVTPHTLLIAFSE